MPRARPRAILVVIVLLGAVPPAAAATVTASATGGTAQAADVTVSNVTYTGEGQFNASADRLEVWRSGAHEFTATVSTDGPLEGKVCMYRERDGESSRLDCRAGTVQANATGEVTVTIDEWPEDATGTQRVVVAVRENGSTVARSEPVELTVLERDGDVDGDGLTNERELSVGSDLRTADTDGDGLDDATEVDRYGTSPTNDDTDGDGLDDAEEVDRYGTDPTAADTDGDGLDDAEEIDRYGTDPTAADTDGDGLDDAAEVNTYETNATAPDTDGDGLGDGVEVDRYGTNPTKTDTDGDGLNDALEVNTYETDPTIADTDGDGLEDGPEVDRYGTDPTVADTDGDGLDDGAEVNRYGTDPTAADTDDDGLEDGPEVNRYGTDPTSADSDGDGRSDDLEVDRGPLNGLFLPVIALGALATVMSVAGGVLYRSERGVGSRFALPWTDDGDDPPPETAEGESRAGDDAETVPPEFLSNEERIQRLLADNGGRMRQAAIVERTGWSKSKVSRVLSDMADEDRVVKVDVGKGNVITLPDRVPPGAESPFED